MEESLSTRAKQQLRRFSRQYFQLQLDLDYPDSDCLRDDTFQQVLYSTVFSGGPIRHAPPQRFQLRVLKKLLRQIEQSIQDWDEEGISDDLMNHLSFLIASTVPSEAEAALQKSYVTYSLSSLPADDGRSPTVTLLEARNLMSAAGTTGLRTWDAALHLGNYLSQNRQQLVEGKSILELGTGTGYVAVLCAKHLGAKLVIASDGSDDVVAGLPTNFFLNDLQELPKIEAKELKWGRALVGSEHPNWNAGRHIDLVLGADVTFDGSAVLALLSTVDDLFDLNPDLEIIIAATIRNAKTFETFREACRSHKYSIVELESEIQPPRLQQGPFYSNKVPIQLCRVSKSKPLVAVPST